MKIFISNYKKNFLIIALCFCFFNANAQDSTKFIKRVVIDTSQQKLNMDALYNRPFLAFNKLPLAIGGYIEANTEYTISDGVSEGFNFQMRRMTLFFSSTVANKIKFLSEIEFEEGTKEINIETAALDVEFNPLLNIRGGILLNPIGGFNQNHDGPRWDFIDRPISATQIIPATLSNVGFGLHGKYFYKKWIFGYETYLSNGFNDKLILNEKNQTSFHEAKEDADKFEKSNSGLPMITAKVAIRNRDIGEIGLSYLTTVYNQFKRDGVIIDKKRKANIIALDFNTTLFKNKINIVGEVANTFIQLPKNYIQNYGSKQMGAYVDVVGTVLNRKIFGWKNAKVNLGLRLDYADYNQDKFRTTNLKIYDETWAITPSIAFKPVGTTVIRLNYKLQKNIDIVGNPPASTATILFGISSYF